MRTAATSPWVYLVAAIVLEVTATLSIKAAQTQPLFYIVVALGYAGAFTALALVLRAGMALGVAYGLWAASGVALTAVFSSLIYGEPFTALMGVGLVLIMGGVLCVELGSPSARETQEAS